MVFLSRAVASSSLPVLETQAKEVHYGSDPQHDAAAGNDDEEYGAEEARQLHVRLPSSNQPPKCGIARRSSFVNMTSHVEKAGLRSALTSNQDASPGRSGLSILLVIVSMAELSSDRKVTTAKISRSECGETFCTSPFADCNKNVKRPPHSIVRSSRSADRLQLAMASVRPTAVRTAARRIIPSHDCNRHAAVSERAAFSNLGCCLICLTIRDVRELNRPAPLPT